MSQTATYVEEVVQVTREQDEIDRSRRNKLYQVSSLMLSTLTSFILGVWAATIIAQHDSDVIQETSCKARSIMNVLTATAIFFFLTVAFQTLQIICTAFEHFKPEWRSCTFFKNGAFGCNTMATLPLLPLLIATTVLIAHPGCKMLYPSFHSSVLFFVIANWILICINVMTLCFLCCTICISALALSSFLSIRQMDQDEETRRNRAREEQIYSQS